MSIWRNSDDLKRHAHFDWVMTPIVLKKRLGLKFFLKLYRAKKTYFRRMLVDKEKSVALIVKLDISWWPINSASQSISLIANNLKLFLISAIDVIVVKNFYLFVRLVENLYDLIITSSFLLLEISIVNHNSYFADETFAVDLVAVRYWID